MYFHTAKAFLGHLLCLLCDRLQTVDKQRGDTGDQFHDSTHRHTQEQHLLDVELGSPADEYTHDDTQHERLSQHTEPFLESFGIDIRFG